MKKEKSSVKTGRKLSKIIMSLLLLVGIVVSAILIWNVVALVIDAYKFDITLYKTDMASTIYAMDADGDYVEYEQLYSDEKRVWVPIEEIPEHVQKAAVAIEDERFYSHQGVDIKRTIGALGGYLTGRRDYGGSTITQQLIKNVTNEKDTTATRKAKEIFRALVLETQLEKDEILEYYLNVVYFANSSYGIQTAAQTYFAKDASELTLAEGAAIVGITQAPSYYDPFVHPDHNKEKQEIVLAKMLELNLITKKEYDEAVAQELIFIEDQERHDDTGGINSFFAEAVVEELTPELAAELGITEEQAERLIYTGGLKIYSTLDPAVQKSINEVYEEPDTVKEDNPNAKSKYFPTLSGEVQPQSAIVVISAEDGSVKGIYGQVGKKDANLVLNRAVNTVRQPGSTIKPLAVYGPAIELGLVEPGSTVVDEPFSIGNWSPKNWYSGRAEPYRGTVTIEEAVAQSMNIPAVKVLQMVGLEKSFDFAKNKLGLSNLLDPEDKNWAPLSLGGLTNGVTVLEMTAAYNTYAANGIYTEPYFYTKVLDRDGNIILEKDIVTRRVFAEKTAKKMTGILKVTAEGSLGFGGRPLAKHQSAGKTGSTNEDKDKWYIGFTTYYTAGVWYGYDQPETLPYSATSMVTHRVWKNVMLGAHENLPATNFQGISYPIAPVEKYYLCEESGLVAVDACPNKKEVKKEETEGIETCTIHGEEGTPSDGGELADTPEAETPQPERPDPNPPESTPGNAISRQ